MNTCTLNDPEVMQCCCNCAHLRPVHFHCCTKPKPTKAQRKKSGVNAFCVCSIVKSLACAPPESGRIYDNWPQHSAGCELYEAKKP